jgi:uncharacterized protein (TIRG00374 family)
LISAAALYFAFRKVPFADLVIYLAQINYFWVIPAVMVVIISFILRALRWRIILRSSSDISFRGAFHPMMIGFMLNCILPGRVGEVARPIILQRKEDVPFSTGLATVVAERVFDVVLLLILFAAVVLMVPIDPELDILFGSYHFNRGTLVMLGEKMFMLCIFLIAGILMVLLSPTRNIINGIIMRIPSLFFFTGSSFKKTMQKKVCLTLVRFVDNFAFGFAMVHNIKNIGICAGLSIVIWGLAAFSYYIMALGCPGIDLSFSKLTAVMIIICFFIALPSVPGFWGVWEAGGVFALSLFGISQTDAAGFTLTNHAVQMFPVIIIGLMSALVTGVNVRQVSYENKEFNGSSK